MLREPAEAQGRGPATHVGDPRGDFPCTWKTWTGFWPPGLALTLETHSGSEPADGYILSLALTNVLAVPLFLCLSNKVKINTDFKNRYNFFSGSLEWPHRDMGDKRDANMKYLAQWLNQYDPFCLCLFRNRDLSGISPEYYLSTWQSTDLSLQLCDLQDDSKG